ncbi:DUF559 domain-containing protein [Salinibacterium soli]|uniref:DUF559 domain-containing protein n=1 Tax=Antiquaquibacter soli TaxID=3064523 RepID=A0ABT9BIB8_9MICO|nr:DUF559 domain-containing protein [Protaetiibacter sp. WY-16]MDO7880774.1 DUF559 domain-containing protein [Protaetiibacter sp. WY-16]
MRLPQPLPPLPEQFSTSAAMESGVSARRLRARDLHSLHGLRHAGERPPTVEEKCRMLALRIPAHGFFSHSTAALLWGAPLPWGLELEPKVHVSVASPAARLHSRDVIGHRLDIVDSDVTTWGGLRLSSPARTWVDLATQLGLGDLVAVGDYLIHHRAPFTDRVELARLIARSEGARGIRLAREALALLSERAESRPESLLRVILARSDLPTAEINHVLVDTDTGQQTRPDFLFRDQQVILEYQGDYHRTRAQWRRDMTRRTRLEAQGWKVVELNADDLRDPAELVTRIRALLAR